jgi:hypothetical protein
MKDNRILYRHKESQTLYVLIDHGSMKDRSTTNEWVPSVTYKSCDTLKTYTRPASEFKDDFEFVASVPNIP